MEAEWKHLGRSFKLIADHEGNLQGIRGFNGTTPDLWTLQGGTRTIQKQFTDAAEIAGTALTRISNQIIPSCVTQERDPLQRWMAALETSINSVREARLLWESFNDDEDKSVTLISYLEDLVQLSVNLCEFMHEKTESSYYTRKNTKRGTSRSKRGRPIKNDKISMHLNKAGIMTASDLKIAGKLRNAFAAISKDSDKLEIPGYPGDRDWMDLLNDPQRSDGLSSVKEALRKMLARSKKK
jgi:hypothetical protein